MLTIAYYFLQVILCSAIMMAYYLLVLRNNRFHQYNRFYLLSIAIIPWLVPLIKINIHKPSLENSNTPIELVKLIADNNSFIEQSVAANDTIFTWDAALLFIYSGVCSMLLLVFVVGLLHIWKLLKQNSYKPFNDFFLVLTKADGTPFSFFKFIFWNTDIDLNTQTGKQILQHEITHVHEKHSADKLLIQLILIIGWPNPVFWLLKKELHLVHEFIADNKAVANGCTETLATLLLTTAYPKQQFILTNQFFYSPIKRRIMMMNNQKHPKFSYIRRLIALPLLAVITLLFAFRTKDTNTTEVSFEKVIEKVVNAVCNTNTPILQSSGIPYHFKKNYTVVIDAGHGGYDVGAMNENLALREKEIALAIAKLVAKNNNNSQIEIVLTRNEDEFIHPQKRAEQSNKVNADLFISLHCNSAVDLTEKGVVVYVAKKDKAKNDAANNYLASTIIGSLTNLETPIKGILTKEIGIWVLQNTNCPSALIECGYLSNDYEAKKLASKSYQQKIAASVLNGIQAYLKRIENNAIPNNQLLNDTIPPMKKGDKVIIEKMHFEGKNGYTVDIKGPVEVTKKGKGNVLPDSVLWIVDGKEVVGKTIEKINSNLIESVNVLKGESAKLLYGEKGKHGVIEVRLKKGIMEEKPLLKEVPLRMSDTPKNIQQLDRNVVFIKAMKDPNFIGGKIAFNAFLNKNLKIPTDLEAKNAPAGIYNVDLSFVIESDGRVSNIKALNNPGFSTVDAAIKVMEKCPHWQPAIQNGRKVAAIVKHTISFKWKTNINIYASNNNIIGTSRMLGESLVKMRKIDNSISEVYWIYYPLTVHIVHQNGYKEVFNLEDAESKKIVCTKYSNETILTFKPTAKNYL